MKQEMMGCQWHQLDHYVRALCAFLSCSLLTTTVLTHVFIEQINDDDDDDVCKSSADRKLHDDVLLLIMFDILC